MENNQSKNSASIQGSSDETLGLLSEIKKYSGKYELSFQFWGEGNMNAFIAKDGVDLISFGGRDTIEELFKDTLEYLYRINRVPKTKQFPSQPNSASIQGSKVSDEEIERLISMAGNVIYLRNMGTDAHIEDAYKIRDEFKEAIQQHQQGSKVSDEEIEKLAEKEFPMQTKEEFYSVDRDTDFMYEDYTFSVLRDRSIFRQGYKANPLHQTK